MDWFKRIKEGITTQTHQKKETPDGLWNKCPKCKKIVSSEEFKLSLSVCQHCNYHARIGSIEYFDILFDKNSITELNKNLLSADPLNFKDTKKYSDRLKDMQKKTGLNDAVRTAYGTMNKENIVIAAMDFNFIGGSMGSVVGEKLTLIIEHAKEEGLP